MGGTRLDPRRFSTFLRAVAGLSAQPATFAAGTPRMQEHTTDRVGAAPAPELHERAQRPHLVEDQPAWHRDCARGQHCCRLPIRHLVDPSLAAALLGVGSDRLLDERETWGFPFESQVVHDLRVFAQAMDARGVFHCRDVKGRDGIDAVVEPQDGC